MPNGRYNVFSWGLLILFCIQGLMIIRDQKLFGRYQASDESTLYQIFYRATTIEQSSNVGRFSSHMPEKHVGSPKNETATTPSTGHDVGDTKNPPDTGRIQRIPLPYYEGNPLSAPNTRHVDSNSSKFERRYDFDPTKRSFIIHIGPSKTGTTTIQTYVSDHSSLLALDNYTAAGRGASRFHNQLIHPIIANDECLYETRDAVFKGSKARDVPCWQFRVNALDVAGIKNVFISDEGFSYDWESLRNVTYHAALQVVLQDEWNLLVVPTYRRYFEWGLSVIKEKNGATNGCTNDQEWKHQGGQPCFKHWETMENFLSRKKHKAYTARFYKNIDVSSKGWADGGVAVSVLNFHEEDFVSSLFCEVIPDMKYTCQHRLNLEKGSHHNRRESLSAAAANIVFEAGSRNILNVSGTTRQEANRELELFLEKNNVTYADLPLSCPPESSLQQLLKKSLQFEELVVPDFYKSDSNHSAHRESFRKIAYERKEMCDLVPERLLVNVTSWQGLLDKVLEGKTA